MQHIQGDSQHELETGNEHHILVTSDQHIKQRQDREGDGGKRAAKGEGEK